MSWPLVWAAWLLTVAVSFAGLEWLSGKETLSATTRRWLGVDPPKPWRRTSIVLFMSAVLGFAAWFVPHIVL
ncbi:MAG TPA: hypothetical protein VFC19_49195 [Candidatus Limnocylindrales bacterium]|nr:hypothetical protein [Candidatus Limnocylindrales bacterium]